jgi:hypothetical protein
MVDNESKSQETTKEKSNSLKSALKMKAYNNGAQVYNPCCEEIGKKSQTDCKRHVSLLCEYFDQNFQLLNTFNK